MAVTIKSPQQQQMDLAAALLNNPGVSGHMEYPGKAAPAVPQRTLKIEGHEGLDARVVVESGGPSAVMLALTDDQKIQQLKTLLARALNCLESPPQWAMELADALDARLPPTD